MSSTQAELLLDCRNRLGEMPRWDPLTRCLHWIDVPAPGRTYQLNWETSHCTYKEFPHPVTSLVKGADGGWLLATAEQVLSISTAGEQGPALYSLPPAASPHRFNDGNVDRAGRLWIGSMPNNLVEPARSAKCLPTSGGLLSFSSNGAAYWFAEGFACPNAICWSPDAALMYIADSVSAWLYAYPFHAESGRLGARRHFCHLHNLGIPDGAAVDVEGCIWNARWGAGVVARIDPCGRLRQTYPVPVSNPTACCFGGPHNSLLFVTSARLGLSDEQLACEPLAGSVFVIETATVGLVVNSFG